MKIYSVIIILIAILVVSGCGEPKADIETPKSYDNSGLTFNYPKNWTITEDIVEGEIRYVFVETPGDAIVIIQLLPKSDSGTVEEFSRSFSSEMVESISIGEVIEINFDALDLQNGYSRIKEEFSISLLGEEVPLVRTYWSKDYEGLRCFIICQSAPEDLAKVAPGFDLIAWSLKYLKASLFLIGS